MEWNEGVVLNKKRDTPEALEGLNQNLGLERRTALLLPAATLFDCCFRQGALGQAIQEN
jgi:hypothetical protein